VQNPTLKGGSHSTKYFQVHFATLYHKFETSAFEGTFLQLNSPLYDTNLSEIFVNFRFINLHDFVSCNSYVPTICIVSHTVKLLSLAYMK